MIVKSILVFEVGSTTRSAVEIDVPGLGVVKIDNCVSDESVARIKRESIAALQARMGRPIQKPEAK